MFKFKHTHTYMRVFINIYTYKEYLFEREYCNI